MSVVLADYCTLFFFFVVNGSVNHFLCDSPEKVLRSQDSSLPHSNFMPVILVPLLICEIKLCIFLYKFK